LLDLPGVGQNLQDHLDICTLVRCKQPLTYDRVDRPLSLLRNGWNYLIHRRGAFSSNLAESGGFVLSRYAQDDRPDIQLHFVPALLDDHGRNRLEGDGMTIHACSLRPRSRGQLLLKSANPLDAPALHANYLTDEYDVKMMLECAALGRRLFAAPAFAGYAGSEYFPGDQVRTESELLAFIRRKAESIYHPVGTCKMGGDEMAVVDPGLAVHGVQDLYVVDASVMPTLVSGNTNAPTVMIAERAAHLLRS
jgi:choline dehydrogenase